MQLVRSICSDWEDGRYARVDWAHPQIDYLIADGPEPSRWTGVSGMAQGWRDFLSAWEDAGIQVDEYRELDDERVLVLFARSGRGRTSGLELDQIASRGATLFHIRDGSVTRLALYFQERNVLDELDLER
jgi:hypothetical protein